MSKLTKEQALAFRKRWQIVNAAEIKELRNTSLAEKLQQTAALMASVQAMGWSETLDSDETEIWQRWQQLREKYRG
ncbi:MAG: hypothetical protein O7G31_15810 [Calditrichaeota bacterium]|nr:hypothetical protein [Calditrichota bacterium]